MLDLFGKLNLTLLVTALVLSSGASAAETYGDSSSKRLEKPPGLSGHSLAAFEHLSEGGDVYPYDWMIRLQSAVHPGHPFLEDLDSRFGIQKTHEQEKYLLDWTGMTVGWSNQPPTQVDAFRDDATVRSKPGRNGQVSIKMAGTNCAMCHSGGIRYGSNFYPIPGAPSGVDIRAFFEDLSFSTIKLLIDQKSMTRFLTSLGIANPRAEAKQQIAFLTREMGGFLASKLTLIMAKTGNTRRLYEARPAIKAALERLLRLTYGLKPTDDLGELSARMNYLSALMVGTNPDVQETAVGPGRSDAFGRIGNLTLRGDHMINLTAPARFPFVWGLKYNAWIQYAASTNSVALRNVGQALGLGAVVTDPKTLDSTVNMTNLDRMEKVIYRIKVPQWEAVFKNEPSLQVDQDRATRGQAIYENKCAKCHDPQRHVGPTGRLLEPKITDLFKLGTDPKVALNMAVPADGKPFSVALDNVLREVRERYYQVNQVDDKTRARFEARNLRGGEFFRDTYRGELNQAGLGTDYANVPQGSGYRAPLLAGIWAAAPFLHNGSVPTILDLLSPAKDRPAFFNVNHNSYDPKRLGFKITRGMTDCKGSKGFCFDSSQLGNSNAGHEMGTDLAYESKLDLVEYLKVMAPQPEYSW